MNKSNLPQPSRPSGIPRMSRLPLPKSTSTSSTSTLRKIPSRNILGTGSQQFKLPSRPTVPTTLRQVPSRTNLSRNVEPTRSVSRSSSRRNTATQHKKDSSINSGFEEPTTPPGGQMSLEERTIQSISKL